MTKKYFSSIFFTNWVAKTPEKLFFLFCYLLVHFASLSCNPQNHLQHETKIIGGSLHDNQKFFASLVYQDPDIANIYNHKCGAVFIRKDFLLTAAHCVINTSANSNSRISPKKFKIRVGFHNNDAEKFRILPVRAVLVHPLYKDSDIMAGHDIAVIQLEDHNDPAISSLIEPINVVSDDFELPEKATAFGVGTFLPNIQRDFFRSIELPLITNDQCSNLTSSRILPNQICAGYLEEDNQNLCFGDSGGPLVIDDEKGNKVLYGIASWISSQTCARKAQPSVYTKLSYFKSFIDQSIDELRVLQSRVSSGLITGTDLIKMQNFYCFHQSFILESKNYDAIHSSTLTESFKYFPIEDYKEISPLSEETNLGSSLCQIRVQGTQFPYNIFIKENIDGNITMIIKLKNQKIWYAKAAKKKISSVKLDCSLKDFSVKSLINLSNVEINYLGHRYSLSEKIHDNFNLTFVEYCQFREEKILYKNINDEIYVRFEGKSFDDFNETEWKLKKNF